MHGNFRNEERGSFVRRLFAARRWFWLGMAALLLTGMAQRSAGSRSMLSSLTKPIEPLIKPVQDLVEKVTSQWTSPRPAPARPTDIDPERELVIRSLAVVNSAYAEGMGPWSFGFLMKNLAPPNIDPADFAEQWLLDWSAKAAENPDDFWVLPSDEAEYPDSEAAGYRAASILQFLSSWPRTANGKLDLSKSPFRLQAVINRLDRNEGRLSYCAYVANTTVYEGRDLGEVLDLSLIFEYALPAVGADGTVQDAAWWANQWHQLSQYPLHSPEYREALKTLTNRFTVIGVSPERPFGSALSALRTNEQVSDLGPGTDVTPVWQLTGFKHSPTTGLLEMEQLPDTPNIEYDKYDCNDTDSDLCQQQLVDYLLENRAGILAGTWHVDSARIQLATYGPVFPTMFSWLKNVETPAGLSDDEWEQLRITFSNLSCNGCHGLGRGYRDTMLIQPHEFLQVSERDAREPSSFSPFLKQQIQDVRIPNMLSYIAPQDARARRADPSRQAAH